MEKNKNTKQILRDPPGEKKKFFWVLLVFVLIIGIWIGVQGANQGVLTLATSAQGLTDQDGNIKVRIRAIDAANASESLYTIDQTAVVKDGQLKLRWQIPGTAKKKAAYIEVCALDKKAGPSSTVKKACIEQAGDVAYNKVSCPYYVPANSTGFSGQLNGWNKLDDSQKVGCSDDRSFGKVSSMDQLASAQSPSIQVDGGGVLVAENGKIETKDVEQFVKDALSGAGGTVVQVTGDPTPGPQGIAGANGINGTNGVDGADGAVGVATVSGGGLILTGQNLSLDDSCLGGQILQWDGSNWVCASVAGTDSQTLSLAANVLAISGGNSVNLSGYLDNTDSQALSWNGGTRTLSLTSGGSVVISDSDTTYSAGNGLSLGGTTFSINSPTCAGTTKLIWNGTAFSCAADVDTDTDTTNFNVAANGGAGQNISAGGTVNFTNGTGTTASRSGSDISFGLANTAVTGGTYSASNNANGTLALPQFTVDAQGRLTAASTSNVTLTGIANSQLANSAITVNTAGPLAGGGSVSLGGSLNLSLDLSDAGDSATATTSSGSGLEISGNEVGLLRGCSSNQLLKWNSGSLRWECASDTDTDTNSGGTVTSITAGTGLSGGAITTSGTINIANTGVTAASYGSSTSIPVITVNAQGQITAASSSAIPTATTSTTGLLTDTDWDTFNGKENVLTFNGNGLFSRSGNTVTGLACSAGQIPKWTAGTFACGADDNSGSAYTAGNGLSLSVNSFSINSPTCAGTDKLTWNGTAFTCASDVDTDTDTTYSAGTGLSLSGTTFNLANTAVTGGTYSPSNNANGSLALPQFTVDAQGRLTAASTTNVTLTGIANSQLTNSAITVNTAGGLTGGSSVSLGGSINLSLDLSDAGDSATASTNSGSGLEVSGGEIGLIRGCSSSQLLKWNSTSLRWECAADVDTDTNSGGTVTSVTAGTGLSGGTITSTGTIDIANTGVTAASYGSSTSIPVITVNAQGQITAASSSAIPTATTSTTGLLTDTDWDTFNGKENVLTFNGNGLFSRSGNTVTGLACTGSQIPKWNAGAFACGADVDTDNDTTYSAGNGLSLGGTTFSINSPTCAGTDKLTWSGTAFSCAADVDTDTDTTNFNVAAAGTGGSQNITSGGTVTFGNGTGTTATRSGSTVTYGLNNTAVSAGTYSPSDNANGSLALPQFTVDAQGRLTAASTTNVTLTGIANSQLANSAITVNTAGGLTGGTSVSLGGSINLSLDLSDSGDTATATTNSGSGLEVSGGEIGLIRGCSSSQLLKWNSTSLRWECAADVDTDTNSGGTVTSITAGTGLSGGTITTTGTIDIAATGVTAATYGSSTSIPVITVNAQGQITAASSSAIPTATTSTTGLLTDTDWDTFNGKENVLTFNGNGLFSRSGNTVTGLACIAGEIPKWTTGAFACGVDSGGSSYVAGNGLSLGGSTFSINSPTCAGTDKLQWTGTAFICSADVDTDTGVTSVGTIDSQTKSANGAVISGTSLVLQTADGSNPGLVSTTTQTFAGDKTFSGSVNANGDVTLGNAAADGITITGEIRGASPLAFEGATNDGVYTTFAITDPTLARTITFPDRSGTVSLSGDTFTGDVTGTLNSSGATALTIAANSVALGTDTTGDYVAGNTAGNGISVTGSSGEGWSPTISINAPTCAGTDKLTWNGSAFSCASDVDTDTDTTNFNVVAQGTVGSQNITSGDTVTFNNGTGTTATRSGSTVTYGLNNTAVSAGTYSPSDNANGSLALPQFTVDAQGRLTAASTTNVTLTGIANSQLTNSAITVNTAGGLSGGSSVSLGGSINLSLDISDAGDTATATTNSGSGLEVSGGEIGLIRGCSSNQLLKWNSTSLRWECAADTDTNSGGTVTSITAGTGLSGGTITTSGTIDIANTGVTAATYGSSTSIPVIAVNAQGQITSASSTAIPTSSTSTTGLLTDTDWDTFNGKENVLTFTGNGLFSRSGNTVTGLACSTGEIPKWTGGIFACGTDIDTDTDTTYSAGNGLSLGGTTFSINSPTCAGTDKLTWSGTAFSCAADVDTDTGVTSVGTIDSQAKSANGAVISGTSLVLQTADGTSPGLVSTGAQTFAGDKTFSGNVNANGDVTLGNASADGITITGEIRGASPLAFEGATNDGVYTTFAITDPTTARTITFPDRSGTVSLSGDTFTGDVTGTLNSTGATTLTIAANSVALGTDTTGDYVSNVTAGGGLTGTATGEGSTPTLAIVSSNGGIVVNADDIALTIAASANALSSTTSSGSGLEILSSGLTLLQGCSNSQILKWNETTDVWECSADVDTDTDTGVTSVGTIDSQTKSANGAVISGTVVYLQTADASAPGLVSTGTQTFAGDKTFNGNVITGGNLTANGDVTLGNAATDAITFTGEVRGASPLAFEGVTNDGVYTTFAITDPTVARTVTFADRSGTVSLSGDTFTGDVTGTLNSTGATALTIAANSVALGTDTTGNYVADVAAGTGLSVSGTPGEGWTPTVSLANTAVSAGTYAPADNANGSIAVPQFTVDAQGRLTAASTTNITPTGIANAQLANSSLTVTAGAGLANGGSVSLGGSVALDIGAGNGITVNANDITIDLTAATDALSANTSSSSGLEVLGTGLTLLQGCSNSQLLKWNETTDVWECSADIDTDTGVTSIGTIDSQTKSANGAVISGSVIYFQTADASNVGLVSTSTQTFAGNKTFNGNVIADANLTVNGDVTLGNAATDGLTFTGEVRGASPLAFEGATNDGVYTTFAITDPTGARTITFPDRSGTVSLSGDTFTGDVTGTLNASGATTLTIAANSVALGTDTTGDYVSNVTAGGGLTGTATGEGSTPTLAIVSSNGGIVVNADDIALTIAASANALSSTTSSGSGLEILSSGVTLLQGCSDTQLLKWNETTDVWVCAADTDTDTGVTSVGTIDSQTKSANGAVISGTVVYLQTADATAPGLVSTGTQTFAGDKTFNGNVVTGGNLTANGDVTLGNAATDAITFTGEVRGASPLAFEGATNDGVYTTFAITDPTGARTITFPDASGTVCLQSSSSCGFISTTLTNGQILIGNGSNVATAVTPSGDVTISNTGVTTIGANSVALGTDTTGDYVAGNTAGNGISVSGSTGEGWSPTISINAPTCAGTDKLTWNGSAFSCAADVDTDTGVTSIGTIDSQTKSANGAVISGTSLVLQTADGSSPGLVSTTTQTFAGDKTFSGSINANGDVTLGNAAADGITITGEIRGASPLAFEGATNDGVYTTFAITDPTLARTITFPDRSGTVSLSGDTFTGDVTGTLNSSGATALTIAANSVALGTDTTGNYVADVTAGTGLSVSGTPGEGWTPTVGLANTAVIAGAYAPADNANGSIAVPQFTVDAQGRLTAASTTNITPTGIANSQLANSSVTVTAGNGLTTGGLVSLGGTVTLDIGAGNGITVNANDVTIDLTAATDALSATTSSSSGLEVLTTGLTLLQGCSDGQLLKWNETTDVWECGSDADTGVTSIGTIDSQTKSANGAVISGTSLVLQTADATAPGLVSTGAQTFAGDKTFNDDVIIANTGSLTVNSSSGGPLLQTDDSSKAVNGEVNFLDFHDDSLANIINAGALSGIGTITLGDTGIATNVTGNLSAFGSVFIQNAVDSTNAFQINDSASVSVFNLDTTTSRVGIGAGAATPGYTLDVDGDINISSGSVYRANGTAGLSSVTCSGGQFLQNQNVRAGLTTAGTCANGGVNTIGTFSGSSIANGASISGTTITFGPADASNPGMVTTGTQTFAGAKTFNGALTFASTLNANGDVTIGNAASDGLTITSEIRGSLPLVFEGITNDGVYTTFAITDPTSARTIIFPDRSGTVSLSGDTFTGDVTGTLSSSGATVLTIDVNSVALGTDTTGDYVANVTAGGGLTGTATGEGSTPTLAIVSSNGGIVVNADDIALTIAASADALSATTSSGSGLEVLSTGLTLLQGCSDGQLLKWNETTDVWGCSADIDTDTGVTSIGTLDSLTKSANGAVISGNTLVLQTADATMPGLVSTGTQTFAGDKTFNGDLWAMGDFWAKGDARFVDSVNSVSAFIIQNSDQSVTLFNVDTVSNAATFTTDGGFTVATSSGQNLYLDPTIFYVGGLSGAISYNDSSGVFEVSNGGGITGLYYDIPSSRLGLGTGYNTPSYTLDVGGDVNIASGAVYRANGTAGLSSVTCSGGQVLQNQNIRAGLTTAGTCAADAGVTTIGTIDSQTKSANGAVISGTSLVMQNADASFPGLVSTGTQSFAGNKTFTGNVITNGSLQVDGSTILGDATTDTITAKGSMIANAAATATTDTTSGTGTNTTTVTISGTSFANGDVILIDNAGQDYYTRVTAGGGTSSLTVSPAVTFETARTVTKYNVQNIGATDSDYTTASNRFFQGYFLGGVVAGAGTTTLSDGRLSSTVGMNFDSPSYTFTNTADSTNAFRVNKANGESLVKFDTATTNNLLTNGNFEANTSGWAALGSATIAQNASNAQLGTGSMSVTTTAAANDGAKYNYTLASHTKYTATFYVKQASLTATNNNLSIGRTEDGSTESDCATSVSTTTGAGWSKITCVFTTANVSGTNYIYVKQTDTTARTFYVDAVQLESVTAFNANTDFESGTTGWGVYNASTISASSAQAYTGSQSLQVETDPDAGASDGAVINTGTVQPNTTYHASFMVRLDGTTAASKTLSIVKRFDAADGVSTTCTSATVTADTWTNLSCTFTTGATATSSPFIGVVTTGASDGITVYRFWIDNAVVAPVKWSSNDIGRISLNGSIDSPLTVRGAQDSTSALQVQQKNGKTVLAVDTLSGRVGINTDAPTRELEVNGQSLFKAAVAGTSTLEVQGTTGTTAFNVVGSTRAVSVGANSGTSNASLSVYGTYLQKTMTNTANAFRIQDASGTTALSFTTTSGNRKLSIGGTGTGNDGGFLIANSGGSIVTEILSAGTGLAFYAVDDFQVNSYTTGNPMITADGTTGNVGIGQYGGSYPLDVIGDINSSTGYRIAGTAGATTTCSGGQFLQNQVATGGLTTGGTCANAVTTVGAFGGSIANGASISGNTITFGEADATNPGMVSTGTQTFAGSKTLTGNTTVSGAGSNTKFRVLDSGGFGVLTVSTNSGGVVTIGTASGNAPTFIVRNNTKNVFTVNSLGGTMVSSLGSYDFQNNAGTSMLSIEEGSGAVGIGLGPGAASYPLDVIGDINTSTGYNVGGVAGATTTCSGGQFLQDQVVVGGLTTGGTCAAVSGSGVTTVGAFSGSSQTNGASISGSTITFGPADGTNPGMVTTGTQTLAGAKTFTSAIAANGGITFDNSTDTLGAFTNAGTQDAANNLITNIGNSGTDFTSGGGLTLAGTLVANGAITLAGTPTVTNGLVQSGVADGGSSIGFNFNTPSYTTAGANLLVVANNGVGKFSVDKDGNVLIASGAAYKAGIYTGITGGCTSGQFVSDINAVGGLFISGTCLNAVTTIGSIGGSIANGGSISGNTLTFGTADGTNPGMVSTGTQTFAGDKTLTGLTTLSNSTSTGTVLTLTANSLTSGNGLAIGSTSTGLTGNAFSVTSASTAAFSNGGIRYNFTGAHTGVGVQVDDATTTGTVYQINASALTTGTAFEITGPSAAKLLRVKNDSNQGFNQAQVIIGEGDANNPEALARDSLYVFGRINTSWNQLWADCLTSEGTKSAATTATGVYGAAYSGSATTGRLQQTATSGVSGVCRFSFATPAANATTHFGSGGALTTQRSLNPVFEARVQSDSNTDHRNIVGFSSLTASGAVSADTNNTNEEAFFRKTAAGTQWETVTRSASGTEEVNTNVGATNTWHRLRIEMDDANAEIRFYVDGTLVATHTTTPTAQIGFSISNSVTSTTSRNLDVDYMRIWSDDPPASIAPEGITADDGVDTTNQTETAQEIDQAPVEDNSNDALLTRIKDLETDVDDLKQYKDVLTTEMLGDASSKKAVFIADVEFRKQVEFSADALFKANVNVDGTLNANGRVVVSNNTGTVTVQPGQTEVQVLFTKPLGGKPNVFVSTENPDVKVVAQTRTKNGFIIKLSQPTTEPLDVQWFAVEKE